MRSSLFLDMFFCSALGKCVPHKELLSILTPICVLGETNKQKKLARVKGPVSVCQFYLFRAAITPLSQG